MLISFLSEYISIPLRMSVCFINRTLSEDVLFKLGHSARAVSQKTVVNVIS